MKIFAFSFCFVKQVHDTDNVEEIRKASESLAQVVQQIGASVYQQQGPAAGGGTPPPPGPDAGPGGSGGGPGGGSNGEDVVDGEFRNA